MTLFGRLLIRVVVLALLVTACGASATQVNSNVVPPPFTPEDPVAIPTVAALVPTPSFEPTAAPAADNGDEDTGEDDGEADDTDTDSDDNAEDTDSDADSDTDTGDDDEDTDADSDDNAEDTDSDTDSDDDEDTDTAGAAEETATATPTPERPTPTPTPDLQPIPVATRVPAPRPTAPPAPRPTPRPTVAPAPLCPGGQVVVNGICACPAGQTKRASDSRCVRFCIQADLTVLNNCVCTGELYDNGGQCVKRCNAGEVPDQFGGCKQPGSN